ncbi:hypothetical protein FSS13T_27260 [Flavobacterium saliperosum S13]|uniref:DUF4377 domain-containing protein n=1 Tax=Flavobacterium saliperosum S13 TaxID=1341155 RepID=A0ABN0QD57_9FLAO|nr:hypothetical protein [Flavobacterium saliperosum]ESU21269.1 hypothetical protein FSS13T_27260 [Flavobacterium saliperosum S13]
MLSKKNLSKIILLVILISVVVVFVKGYQTNNEIKKNGVDGICKFMYCKQFPKTTEANFAYYIEGKLYKNSFSSCPDNYENLEGHYFEMRYLKEDPNKFIVDFAKEIIDTVKIRSSGFKLQK